MRRLPVFALLIGVFSLISCHKYTAPSTAITCTTTAATTSTNASSSSCTDPVTGITIAISPVAVSVTVATPRQFFAGVSGGTNSIVKWQVNGIPGGNDTVGRIDASGKYIAPVQVPSTPKVNVAAVSYEDPKLSVISETTIIAPPTVMISPTCTGTPCTLSSGNANTKTFTATVTNAPSTAVDWLVNNILGGNATVGTITAAGVYTAPNTPPMDSTVTVTADSHDFAPSLANATVTISGYSTSSFEGRFAFSLSGKNAAGAFFRAGSFTADGAGHLSGGLEDANDTSCTTVNPISFIGTYTISLDGRGTMQFLDNCKPVAFAFVLVNNNQLQITGFDATGTATGQANLQDPTFFNAAGLTGSYVFDFGGVHGSLPLSQIGEFTSDGAGNIAGGLVDTNDGGAISSQVPFTGSYQVMSNGRGTATLGSRNFSFYIVSRGSAKFVETDSQSAVGAASGAATQQFTSTQFDATSLSGSIAFQLAGPVPNGNIAIAGSFSPDGNLHVTSGVLDENVSGVATPNSALSSGSTYTLAANGRGTLNFSAGGHAYNFVFYLSTPGNGVLQETDSGRTSDGLFAQQQGAPFSAASVKGNYALQTTGLSAAKTETVSGEINSDGAGAISSGTLDINLAGIPSTEAAAGTYAVPATNLTTNPATNTDGRGTLTLNPSSDNRNFAIYLVSPTQTFVIGIDPASSARLASGVMYRRF